jgi:thioester reductase-like protein
MKSCLLTGATGMVGGFLVKRALILGLPLAVLARDDGLLKAEMRVPQGVRVVRGDLTTPGLGLSSDDRDWLEENCESVLHAGARVNFRCEVESGEPYRTNVDGTRHVLKLCKELGVEKFGYISTAYVCGNRKGVIKETDLDCGQSFQNDYERSKFLAESLVRQATFLKQKLVFRPSVVLGDSKSGYTPTFQGVYGLIQLAWRYSMEGRQEFLKLIGCDSKNGLNLVTADWVAECLWTLFESSAEGTSTHHLTHPQPTTIESLLNALDSEAPSVPSVTKWIGVPASLEPLLCYVREHPVFESSVATRPVPLSFSVLKRIVDFAVKNNFLPPLGRYEIGNYLEQLPQGGSPPNLTIEFTDGTKTAVNVTERELSRSGRSDDSIATIIAKEKVLTRLLLGHMTVESALCQGALVLEAEDMPRTLTLLTNLLRHLRQTA